MPFDGSGNYTPAAAPNFPAVGGTVISAAYYNAVINDIATALTNALTRDGQGKPSAAINWNGQNLTGVNVFGSSSGAVAGNFTVGGTLGVTGNATFSGTVAVTGALTTGGNAVMVGANNLSEVAVPGTARTNLGLGTVAILNSSTDGTLAANSDLVIATQKAVKTYVDTAVTGLLDFKGSTDCSANPNYPAALKGDAYVVSVAGKIGGASGTAVDISDVYLATADNAGGTQAAVGASWSLLEHNLVGALLAANNLSDLASPTTARANLGLGSIATFAEATAAEYRANTATRALSADKVWSAAGAVALTDGATVTPNFSLGINFTLTLGGNRTLANPTNAKVGQCGCIEITQDGTGGRTLAYGTSWDFAGGTAPTLSTAIGARDILFYQVLAGGTVFASLNKAVS